MAAGFCILRNNNNYCTRHNLSSEAANASAAGYFDTLDKKSQIYIMYIAICFPALTEKRKNEKYFFFCA